MFKIELFEDDLMFPFWAYTAYRNAIARHLKRLSYEDRYLRFCALCKDEAINSFVEKIDFSKETFLVVFDESTPVTNELQDIIGLIQICQYGTPGECEFGISVDKEYRGQGMAQALFSRGLDYALHNGYKDVYMNCLDENKAMRHIVEKSGLFINANSPCFDISKVKRIQ